MKHCIQQHLCMHRTALPLASSHTRMGGHPSHRNNISMHGMEAPHTQAQHMLAQKHIKQAHAERISITEGQRKRTHREG